MKGRERPEITLLQESIRKATDFKSLQLNCCEITQIIPYCLLFINKQSRAEAFSGILINRPKQKLDIIKLNNLTKTYKNFDKTKISKKSISSSKQEK